jgi:hypothetical protein
MPYIFICVTDGVGLLDDEMFMMVIQIIGKKGQ